VGVGGRGSTCRDPTRRQGGKRSLERSRPPPAGRDLSRPDNTGPGSPAATLPFRTTVRLDEIRLD